MGTIKLNDGTGGIVYMISLDDKLEIYKKDVTYQICLQKIPKVNKKNPDILFTVSPVAYVGAQNELVARVFIQSCEAIQNLLLKNGIIKQDIIKSLHKCKECLLVCERISSELLKEYNDILSMNILITGQAINPFPQIINLEDRATSFLTNIKIAIQNLVKVYCVFFNENISNPRFDKVLKSVKQNFPKDDKFISFLNENQQNIKDIIDLRNYQEHPTDDKSTAIYNFRLTPNGVSPPSWHVTNQPESLLIDDMKSIIIFIRDFSEAFFLFCLRNAIYYPFGISINEIPVENRNPDCPKRYNIQIDV